MDPIESIARIFTPQAPTPAGHYSQATVAGAHVYISGQLPICVAGGSLADTHFDAQAAQAINNMLAVLTAAGGTPQQLAKVTAYIVGVDNWPRFNAVYADLLPNTRPSRTVVPVPELHHGFLVEIDAVAILAGGSSRAMR
jgi:2-iminobutanoate/2-iminopropanoate deaminase